MRYPCIIVSSSGMVTGGRILHHLLLRLPDPRNQVLFIGFQAPGTRGDTIKSGARSVRIFSEAVPIRAQVAALEQFSDHADTQELLGWLRTFKAPPKDYLSGPWRIRGSRPASTDHRRRARLERENRALAGKSAPGVTSLAGLAMMIALTQGCFFRPAVSSPNPGS